MTMPVSTTCETWLRDTGWIGVRATADLNEHKLALLSLPQPPGPFKNALFGALLSARMGERGDDIRWKVVLECEVDKTMSGALHFPAILADRLARGVYPIAGKKRIALGGSPDWIEGRIVPMPWQAEALEALRDRESLNDYEIFLPSPTDARCEALHQTIRERHPGATIREMDSLAELLGHPTPGAAIRRARAFFPTVAGNQGEQDALLEVEVILRRTSGTIDEDRVDVSGRRPIDAQDDKRALRDWRRQSDRHGLNEWDTLIRFNANFQDTSYQLALAMADRIARGREFPAQGRLIATGGVDLHGRVLYVEEVARKCALILRHIQSGDRVLLPLDWKDELPTGFLNGIRHAQASCVLIERLNG